jgi:uncharacterized protein YycO
MLKQITGNNMKHILYLLISIFIITACSNDNTSLDKLQSGDLIFQTSTSMQSIPIQLATKSKYSHVGMVFKKGEDLFVYEAVSPVQIVDIDTYISRGKGSDYVVKRLKNADEVITDQVLKKMESLAKKELGKGYDIYFNWSDSKMYCSEYIWKIYKKATGLEIGKLRPLKDFDLTSETLQRILKERYGNNIPYNEKMISPGDMFNSELLVEVK